MKRWPQRSAHIFSGPEASPFSTVSPHSVCYGRVPPATKDFPADAMGKSVMSSASKPEAVSTGRHFVSKCTAVKPGKDMGQKGQAGQQLVDEWEGRKGFLLSIGRVGPPTSRMWFLS